MPETQMEIEETITNPVTEIPGTLGRLTPEEQSALVGIRQEAQQLQAKIGEHEFLKMRILARLEELDGKGQEIINGISKRFNLEDGQQWVALGDGTVRLVNAPNVSQNAPS